MALNKIKLGKYIELYAEKCNIPNLTVNDVSGVNREKEFFEPSHQIGKDTSNYKIVPSHYFACNLMHVGRDAILPIAYNHTDKNKIVSPAYHVFRFHENDEILSDYFFLYLKLSEKDRYFWFNTDSSVRDGMSWDDFVNVDIELPSIEIQQKYVDVYNAMLANQQSYEHGLDDLKLTCDAYIEDLRRRMPCERIGKYIEPTDTTNVDLQYGINDVRGISIEKKLIETKADMEGINLSPYLLIQPNEFSYVTVTSRNGGKISIALNDSNKTYICSSSYVVFKSKDMQELLPQYLMLFFSRAGFDRYARFHSWGSARETFDWDNMCDVKIPIPDITIQKSIAEMYTVYNTRKRINERLKTQIKDICPILIKGSLEDGRRV